MTTPSLSNDEDPKPLLSWKVILGSGFLIPVLVGTLYTYWTRKVTQSQPADMECVIRQTDGTFTQDPTDFLASLLRCNDAVFLGDTNHHDMTIPLSVLLSLDKLQRNGLKTIALELDHRDQASVNHYIEGKKAKMPKHGLANNGTELVKYVEDLLISEAQKRGINILLMDDGEKTEAGKRGYEKYRKAQYNGNTDGLTGDDPDLKAFLQERREVNKVWAGRIAECGKGTIVIGGTYHSIGEVFITIGWDPDLSNDQNADELIAAALHGSCPYVHVASHKGPPSVTETSPLDKLRTPADLPEATLTMRAIPTLKSQLSCLRTLLVEQCKSIRHTLNGAQQNPAGKERLAYYTAMDKTIGKLEETPSVDAILTGLETLLAKDKPCMPDKDPVACLVRNELILACCSAKVATHHRKGAGEITHYLTTAYSREEIRTGLDALHSGLKEDDIEMLTGFWRRVAERPSRLFQPGTEAKMEKMKQVVALFKTIAESNRANGLTDENDRELQSCVYRLNKTLAFTGYNRSAETKSQTPGRH